jgi:3,4-dihydroxy 2-butanone 4-phosphate synthase/GTP cyclohydrolase II
LARIDDEARSGGAGVVVYLRGHEGRGIGLANKIRAYQLQEDGLDTVDANTAQGFPADARTYDIAGAILAELGITTVQLMTNNPAKARGLEDAGIDVAAVEPLVVAVGPEADGYLAVKRDRLGHVLPTGS